MDVRMQAQPRPRRWATTLLLIIFLSAALWGSTKAAITSASVTPASSSAGATGNAAVAFTTGLGVPVGGRITVVFPTTFYVAISSSSPMNPTGLDLSSSLAMGANTYTVIVTVATTAIDPGTSVSFQIDGVSNPGDGTTSKYTIRTADLTGSTIESTTNIPGSVITKTSFTAAALAVSTPSAGASLQLTASLTTSVVLRVGSQIEIEFPRLPASTFVIAGAAVTSRTGIDPSCAVSSNTMPFLRVGISGQDVVAGIGISLVIGGMYNPAAQPLGTFSVRTRHTSGTILQETTGIAIADIQSTTLSTNATVKPASFFAGISTTFTVSFPNAAYLLTGAKITVTFPPRFTIASATLAGLSNLPSTGTMLALTSTTATLTLGVGSVVAGTSRGFTLANIINPGSSCGEYIYEYCTTVWESYGIAITDAAGQVYEQTAAVPGSPIVKKPMVFARVRPLVKLPLALTSATLIFTTETTVQLGGSIDVIFPSGFQVGTIVASGHVGIPSASTTVTVMGLQVSLAVAGATIPPTASLSVTFSGITTPNTFATGVYIVRTRDAQANILEEHSTVNGEGCLYLNSCNGHGTCTLFSSTCICDLGWGADSDVAAYRSPDCTTRTCPSGKSWNNLPSDATTSHGVIEECSGMGTCDRSTGKCVCFSGFTGSACQRMTCPNNCKTRGKCVTMRELATLKSGQPISVPTTYTGTTSTWDEDRVVGCACDSAWAVGTGAGEVQVTEYFGGDCSRRHCPTGDDPVTAADETDCSGVTVPGGVSATGNICLVECSNRGICDFRNGVCQCFPGFSGFACQRSDVLSK